MPPELTVIEEFAKYGPVYVALLLIFVFFVSKWWPWWCGPHQEQLDKRWQDQLDRELKMGNNVNELTNRVLAMIEKQQDGYSTELEELKALVREVGDDSLHAIKQLTDHVSQVDKILELFVRERA